MANQTYPTGLVISYTPNALGQPTAVRDQAGGNYATGIGYYPNGAARQFTYGNGVSHSLVLNGRQMPQQVRDNNVASFEYQYDANGNVGAIIDQQRGTGYNRYMGYDGLDRLMEAGSERFGGDNWNRYTYDVLDNILTAKLPGVRENNYWYDAKNRLTNVQNNAGATTVGLSYDPQGNLKNKNGQAYTFDYGNRLRDVTGKESYAYDAYGRRTIAGRPTTRTVQVYTQAGQLFYTEASGKGNTEYVYLNGSLLASRNSGTIKFQHTDALGSPIAVTDTAGQVVERTDYQPYGSPIGKTVDGIGYTGHAMDGATGLTYMQQRYYDQDLGRFLSIDPVAADSVLAANFNRYWYANNNPYRFTDPDGRNSVITTAKDGSISIDIPINFVGPGATQANIDSVKGDISARWSRAYNVKGSSVQVSVQVVPVTKDTPRKVQNTITLTTGPTSDKASQGASFVKDGKTGEWNITSRGMPYGEAAHEAGHLMRADDHYLATVDASGNRVSTPEAGYDKNLMGELGNPPDDRNMGEILSSRKNIYIEEK